MIIKLILRVTVILLLPLSQANAILLDSWNDADLNNSGDYINVTTGLYEGDSYFTLQWMAGDNNELTALGIDKVLYNYTSDPLSNGDIFKVYEGSLGGTDVTADWDIKSKTQAGGGFGSFTRKYMEPSGDNGIDPSILYFLLSGPVTFTPNTDSGSMFAVHVRYGNDCSGWAADGTTTNDDTSGSCTTSVPEPGMVGLLAIGLLGVAVARRRMKV